MTEHTVQLFENEKDCCGCSACLNTCPKGAIEMREDAFGFTYPFIRQELCIGCEKCLQVCNFKNKENLHQPLAAYAAAAKNQNTLYGSASGGAFACAAEKIIGQGGIVFGAAFEKDGHILKPHHRKADALQDIKRLQGSKYVQSAIDSAYRDTRAALKQGKTVLFSGTPCQIDGLYGFLGKDYDNLFTADIVCHGVPSSKLFGDYLQLYAEKKKCSIQDFKFRDKAQGWGLNAKITYADKAGKTHAKNIPSGASSYYDLFLKAETYRESCYACKYATSSRIGDLTLGDYWGFQKEHPELLEEAGGGYSDIRGVSCLLVNTQKGKKLLALLAEDLLLAPSSVEKVARGNGQLRHPSEKPAERDTVLSLYAQGGYTAVESYFKKRNGLRTQYYYLKNALPRGLKKKMKKLIGKHET